MTKFLLYVISGLSTGSICALVALGLAMIYRSTRILNFAHGDITTAGTFFAFMLLGFHFSFASTSSPTLSTLLASSTRSWEISRAAI